MAHPLRVFSFVLISACLLSCGGDGLIDSQAGDGSKPPWHKTSDRVFDLRFGQTVTVASENLTVTFESVKQDSRCPSDVVCVWEGQGIIGLRLIAASADTHFVDLTIYGGCAYGCSPRVAALDTLGYRFELLDLRPYPISDVYTPPAKYQATLAIFPFQPIGSLDGEVVISNEHPTAIQRFSFTLDTVMVNGDVMTLHVGYSGGCTEHEFELHMAPAGFSETLPLQADLYLRHTGEPDPCDSFPWRDLRFDLRPIQHLYEIEYGQIDCIALNVYDFIDPDRPVTKTTVIYHPDGTTAQPWCDPDSQ